MRTNKLEKKQEKETKCHTTIFNKSSPNLHHQLKTNIPCRSVTLSPLKIEFPHHLKLISPTRTS